MVRGVRYQQETLETLLADPLAADLSRVTFVVLDLETTGGAPDGAGITEVGAVKVRGGEPLGEIATLVNPGDRVPPFITVLTGITDAMLTPAPPIEVVLPSVLEFLGASVLVAHNAPYDVGFLKAACARHGYRWPKPVVLDTAALARRALTRDEVPNHRLATLAGFFHTRHRPTHRALDDARATVEVLHGLIARLGSFRVHTLRDTLEFVKAVSPVQRAKRRLADDLPHAPGVYVFRAADGRPLYVGTSTDIAARVRSYFTAGEKRARIREMLAAADRVEALPCAHALEAQVRELRLIAAHAPPYNRRSKFPHRVWWLRLTAEPYPRLSLVRTLIAEATHLGPFRSRQAAELVAAGVHDAVPLRTCTPRLSLRTVSPACVLAEIGRCPAPCQHEISVEEYAARAAGPVRQAVTGDPGPVVRALLVRIHTLAAAQRYEAAATARRRLAAVLRACIMAQRRSALTGIAELVAARRGPDGGWELAVVRHGRLAGAGYAAPPAPPREVLAAIRASAETVVGGPGPVPCATAEETDRILDWLERTDTRLVDMSAGWASPLGGAARFARLLAHAERAAAVGT